MYSLRNKQKIRTHFLLGKFGSDFSGLVRETGLEPVRKNTRPSNVRVCLFRHSRVSFVLFRTVRIIADWNTFVKPFFAIFFSFFTFILFLLI